MVHRCGGPRLSVNIAAMRWAPVKVESHQLGAVWARRRPGVVGRRDGRPVLASA